MSKIVKYPNIKFSDVTEQVRINLKDPKYPYFSFQCFFEKTYVGSIVWSDINEQYAFVPNQGIQLTLTETMLRDIGEKISSLMNGRKLN